MKKWVDRDSEHLTKIGIILSKKDSAEDKLKQLQLLSKNYRNKQLKDNYFKKIDFALAMLQVAPEQDCKPAFIIAQKAFKAAFPNCTIDDAHFKLINSNIAAAILLTLAKMHHYYDFPLRAISVTGTSKEYSFCIYPSSHSFILDINLTRIRKFDSLAAQNKYYTGVHETGESLGTNVCEYILHEIGHILTFDKRRASASLPRFYYQLSEQVPAGSVPDSKYSQQNYREFIAELFLYLIRGGNTERIHPTDLALFTKAFPLSIEQIESIRRELNLLFFVHPASLTQSTPIMCVKSCATHLFLPVKAADQHQPQGITDPPVTFHVSLPAAK